jgi:hypothetical protein
MALSKALREVLLKTLIANTAESAKDGDFATKETKPAEANEYGIFPSEEDVVANLGNAHYWSAYAFVMSRSDVPVDTERYDKIRKYVDKLRRGEKTTNQIDGLKSLSVLVSDEGMENHFGKYFPDKTPIIFLHSEKGYFLEGANGSVGNYSLNRTYLPYLRLATEAEIAACVDSLNSLQQSQVLSHQYFSEVRNALLSE